MGHCRTKQHKLEQLRSQQKRRQSRRPSDAFDLWLERGLHELYDSIVLEPVPDELLRLIREHSDK